MGVSYRIAARSIDAGASEVSSGDLANIKYRLINEPDGWFVSSTTGEIMGKFTENKTYTFQLEAVDQGGAAFTAEDFEFAARTLQKFTVAKFLRDGETHTVAPQTSSTVCRRVNYAVGEVQTIKPITLAEYEGEINVNTVTYTVTGAPAGFLVDPTNGFVQGIPRAEGNYTAMLTVRNSRNDPVVLECIGIQVLPADTANPLNGPGGKACKYGQANDTTQFDDGYTCDCSGTGYAGANCDKQCVEGGQPDGNERCVYTGPCPSGCTCRFEARARSGERSTGLKADGARRAVDCTSEAAASIASPSSGRRNSTDRLSQFRSMPGFAADFVDLSKSPAVLQLENGTFPLDRTAFFRGGKNAGAANQGAPTAMAVVLHPDSLPAATATTTEGGNIHACSPVDQWFLQDMAVPEGERVLLSICAGSNATLKTCEQGSVCQPGTYAAADGSGCSPCSRGQFYQDQPGKVGSSDECGCKSCRPGLFVNTNGSKGAAECEVCPDGTATDLAGHRACPCKEGHYRTDRFGPCFPCEEGVECGKDGQRTLKEGFWWGLDPQYSSTAAFEAYMSATGPFHRWMDDLSRESDHTLWLLEPLHNNASVTGGGGVLKAHKCPPLNGAVAGDLTRALPTPLCAKKATPGRCAPSVQRATTRCSPPARNAPVHQARLLPGFWPFC